MEEMTEEKRGRCRSSERLREEGKRRKSKTTKPYERGEVESFYLFGEFETDVFEKDR